MNTSQMDINVLKFGGTSMNDHETWHRVLNIIRDFEYPVVVVSATARTTRKLIEAAELASDGNLEEAIAISEEIAERHKKIIHDFLNAHEHEKNKMIAASCIKHISEKKNKLDTLLNYTHKQGRLIPSMKDAIASIGEQISSYLLAQCGLSLDMLTQNVEARKIIKTDAEYGRANPNMGKIFQRCGSLETILESGFTPIIGGFYGEAPDGTITTLGFEGSDYTASLIGAAIEAKDIQIWTDVSGVYSSDPRKIDSAIPIPQLSYTDATEMAYFGAKVLHPSTLKPAQEKNIPVKVKNIFKPDEQGTLISAEATDQPEVLALSFKDKVTLATVTAYETLMGFSFLKNVFQVLEQFRLEVDAVHTTEASVTLAVSGVIESETIKKALSETGIVKIEQEKGLISIIGINEHHSHDIMKEVTTCLGDLQPDLIAFSKQKRILNLVLDEKELLETAQNIHRVCFQ